MSWMALVLHFACLLRRWRSRNIHIIAVANIERTALLINWLVGSIHPLLSPNMNVNSS